MDASEVTNKAQQVIEHPWVKRVARLGYISNAVLHIMLGILAIAVAAGSHAEADQGGALGAIAKQPLGAVVLWICAAGAVLLGIWSVVQALLPHPRKLKRLKLAGTGVVFLLLAGAFMQFAWGGHSDSGKSTSSFSVALMQYTGGRALLVLIGLAFIGVGVYFVYRGVTRRFLKDVDASSHAGLQKTMTISGVIGYPAKGIVLAAVGLLFIVSTVQGDPKESTGVDGALKAVRSQDYGPTMLILLGAGLLAYGIFLAFRSRYDSMDS
ncbi:hypothetical protein AUR04nite_28700 [Glutamicibacter uratoxydans]|uniref:DUF1206 domain-containing protein n=1 Tax=Glutamicibacter uratoxydans TaxID=43667 RepID=A0A4Y4DVE4_GLUUR|nr:DUF1206 domain-containing protein [Glutamicibacter uratoxydans]GED07338.1 hypothetical protein AUR04nite_28700 [Glutamicibacter uratoxydans]